MNKKYRLAVGLSVVGVALLYFVVNGTHNFTQYYLTVGQVVSRESIWFGRPEKVSGVLVGKSVRFNAQTGQLSFDLRDGGRSLPVVYYKARPDDFTNSVQAIVSGSLQRNGVFVAENLLVKCPSRYVSKPVQG